MHKLGDVLGHLEKRLAAAERVPVTEPDPEPPASVACEVCGDMGVVKYNVPFDHPNFGKFMPCTAPGCSKAAEHQMRMWAKRYRLARIPPAYQHFTLTSWLERAQQYDGGRGKAAAYNAGLAFLDDRHVALGGITKQSLMFFGPLGTGKTGLVVAMARELLARHVAVLYIRVRDLIEEVQRAYDHQRFGEGDDWVDPLSAFKTAGLLILDEFTIANVTRDRQEMMESIIRYRYGAEMPTLMTANLEPNAFARAWGERTADVINAMAHWLHLAGANIRPAVQVFGDDE